MQRYVCRHIYEMYKSYNRAYFQDNRYRSPFRYRNNIRKRLLGPASTWTDPECRWISPVSDTRDLLLDTWTLPWPLSKTIPLSKNITMELRKYTRKWNTRILIESVYKNYLSICNQLSRLCALNSTVPKRKHRFRLLAIVLFYNFPARRWNV